MSPNPQPPIPIPPPRASALPSPLRNAIYSALLSNGGIRNIEASLTQLLQSTGFHAHLRAYMTDLFRTGQATTAGEAYALAMERVRACMAGSSSGGGGAEEMGSGNGGDGEGEDGEMERGGGGVVLRIPDQVVKEGSRVVRRELERVVVIEAE